MEKNLLQNNFIYIYRYFSFFHHCFFDFHNLKLNQRNIVITWVAVAVVVVVVTEFIVVVKKGIKTVESNSNDFARPIWHKFNHHHHYYHLRRQRRHHHCHFGEAREKARIYCNNSRNDNDWSATHIVFMHVHSKHLMLAAGDRIRLSLFISPAFLPTLALPCFEQKNIPRLFACSSLANYFGNQSDLHAQVLLYSSGKNQVFCYYFCFFFKFIIRWKRCVHKIICALNDHTGDFHWTSGSNKSTYYSLLRISAGFSNTVFWMVSLLS